MIVLFSSLLTDVLYETCGKVPVHVTKTYMRK